MKTYKLTLLGIVALFATGCSSEADEGQNKPKSRMAMTAEEEAISEAEIKSAFTVFEGLYSDEMSVSDRENVMLSPLSLDLCLGMTSNAFAKADRNDIVGRLGASSAAALNEFNKNRINYFSYNGKRAKVSFANSVWANSLTMKSEQDFASAMGDIKKYYDAESRTIDFGANDMKSMINNWCSNKTNGLIPEFLKDEPSVLIQAMFINAMYFDCQWEEPFEKSATKTKPFYSPNGVQRQGDVEMMFGERFVPIFEADNYSMFALPYADCNYSAVFVLPSKDKSIADILPNVRDALLARKLDNVSPKKYIVGIPRFKTEYSNYITDYVSNAGISLVNRELLGYGKMRGAEILQATSLELSEEGTKIAAVTANVGYTTTSPGSITLDRPFLMIVKDNNHGSILLMAAIQMPKE